MGFTGLARWVNAPPHALQLVVDNIRLNYNAEMKSKWNLSVKSYRSTLNTPGLPDRNMYTLTMDDKIFILLEDSAAPTKADVLAVAPPGQEDAYLQNPPHFRNTFLTLSPPGALDQLLNQIKARWVPVRQNASNNAPRSQTSGHQLTVDGYIFAIGTDWLVRFGNVILAGNTVKGMLLEAEYLPLPVLHSPAADGTSELLSNLLTSILPNVKDARTVAVTISDSQWEDVLWNRENSEKENRGPEVQDDDPYLWDSPEAKHWKEGDWVGVDRDQRSAFLIVGALRTEGLL